VLRVAGLAILTGLLYSDRADLLSDLRSPSWGERFSALGYLGFWVYLLFLIASEVREEGSKRRELREEERVTTVALDEKGIAITDRYGNCTRYPWFQLEEVLVFPQTGVAEPGAILLVGGDRQGFIPPLISEREELLAEIVQRGRLEPRREEPEFRRYARSAEGSPE
jgi:hypothetical protein